MSGQCRVLVVDDDPDTQFILPAALAHAGHEARVAADGMSALVLIRDELPDVVILDLAMPGLSGRSVLAMLKAQPETRDIPVIACTAVAGVADAPILLQQGFDEVLLKPVDPNAVLRAVERVRAGRLSASSRHERRAKAI